MPTIGPVSPDTPILSSWGNDVATEVNTNCLKKSGGTMTGSLTMSGTSTQVIVPNAPTADSHATRKRWVDDNFVSSQASLSTMDGDLVVGGNPTAPAVGVRLDASDGQVFSLCNTAGAPNVSLNRTLSGAVVAGQPWINFVRSSSVHGAIAIPAGGAGIYVKSQTGNLDLDAAVDCNITGNNITATATDVNIQAASELILQATGTGTVQVAGSKLGLFGATPVAKPTVTGSRGGNAALASLLTALASLGLIINSTTA